MSMRYASDQELIFIDKSRLVRDQDHPVIRVSQRHLINSAAVTEINPHFRACINERGTYLIFQSRIWRVFTRPYTISSVYPMISRNVYPILCQKSLLSSILPLVFFLPIYKGERVRRMRRVAGPADFSCTRENSPVSAATRSKEPLFVGRWSR